MADSLSGAVSAAQGPAQGAGSVGLGLGFISAFIFPILLGFFLKFFQTLDNMANLGMLNINYGASVNLIFEFLGSLSFLPDLNGDEFIKDQELYLDYFFFSRGPVTEEMEGGFILVTQTLNCLLFFVKLIILIF